MKYQPPIGADASDPYIDANPAAGIEGSAVPAAALEHPMREIVDAIEHFGLVASSEDLTQLRQAIVAAASQPLAALPYPEADTVDGRLVVTPATASAGGTVSIGAGTVLALSEVTGIGIGRARRMTTAPWTSADLLANSTYYLRAQISGSGLLVYTARGSDSDAIPASQVGTPNAASGGGFESTAVDMLLARVVTGNAGTAPTVTALANRSRLGATAAVSVTSIVNSGQNLAQGSFAATLNWARSPIAYAVTQSQIEYDSGSPDPDNDFSIVATTITRNEITGTFTRDYMTSAQMRVTASA